MQNVQNAAEIQQRVINLVELYRTKVGKESQIAKDAKEEKAYWDDANLDAAIHLHEEGFKGPIGFAEIAPDMPEEWVNTLRVNDHLLGHFYSVVAGNDADKKVLSQFLANYYDTSVFTTEEEEFLRSHFTEMVNYIIQTPCDDLDNVNHHDGKDWHLIPLEVLELIKSRVQIPAGSIIYNPFSGFGQMASIYPDCKFYCEDTYTSFNKRWNAFCEKCHKESNIVLGKRDVNLMPAWMKLALYANSIDAVVIEDGIIPSKYDSVVSFIPRIPNAIPGQSHELDFELPADSEIINKVIASYKKLPNEGKMVLVVPKEYLWASDSYYSLRPLWEKMIEDKSLSEIIQLPCVMSKNLHRENFCMVVAEKGREDSKTTLIDARFAVHDSEKKNFEKAFDLSSFKDMLTNSGKEVSTGLRKMVCARMEDLNPEILVPQIYVVEKPFAEENPLPLSKLGAMIYTRIGSLQINLPEDTPWVELGDLSHSYKGPLNISALRKAGCPNNPTYVEGSEDYAFSKSGKFLDDFWAQVETNKGSRVYDYRRCIYLDGTKDAVLFRLSEQGLGIAIVRATGKAIAVGEGIMVICLKDEVDAITLAALLNLPIVTRQMKAYKDFGLSTHLDDILVPTDKRIIIDEVHRLKAEESIISEMKSNFETEQKKFIVKLENYQHTMRKHIREIGSAVRRMSRYVNDMNSSVEEKEYLNQRLSHISEQKGFLSEDIERLNEENTYGEAKPYDIDHCLKGYTEYFGDDVCTVHYSNEIAKESVRKYKAEHKESLKLLSDCERNKEVEQVLMENSVAYVDIAEYNFGKIVRNILENAKKHGFDDFMNSQSNGRKVEISLFWDDKRKMYRIDFRNNGNSLPEGLSKESYGENRKYAGKTGGTGIGGYEVAETVKHYNGDYSIAQDGDWVVISIYLPKSKPYEQERI